MAITHIKRQLISNDKAYQIEKTTNHSNFVNGLQIPKLYLKTFYNQLRLEIPKFSRNYFAPCAFYPKLFSLQHLEWKCDNEMIIRSTHTNYKMLLLHYNV